MEKAAEQAKGVNWDGKEKRKLIRADEVFSILMNHFANPDIKGIMAKFVKEDSRGLTELSAWLLKSRGFSNLVKMKEKIHGLYAQQHRQRPVSGVVSLTKES